MPTQPKQRSIRFDDVLQQRLEQLARDEGRTFSAQVVWLARQALASRSLSQRQPAEAA